MIVENCVS